MTDLIARLAAATEPSRELDGLIFRAVNTGTPDADWCAFDLEDESDAIIWYRRDANDTIAWEAPPNYTASIDAALTLVPEGLLRSLIIYADRAHAFIRTGSVLNPATKEWTGYAATPAIALCIAALQARAARAGA